LSSSYIYIYIRVMEPPETLERMNWIVCIK
jgi:hypothetical protein